MGRALVWCVWCPEHHVIGTIDCDGDSHGMCEAAKERELRDLRALPSTCPHGGHPAMCADCLSQNLRA